MIDDKDLAEDEREQKMLADHYANYPDMIGRFKKRIEIIRLARRYLALRENGVYIEEQGDVLVYEEQLDAAADRLLEGGE
jgi:hypothetical protein